MQNNISKYQFNNTNEELKKKILFVYGNQVERWAENDHYIAIFELNNYYVEVRILKYRVVSIKALITTQDWEPFLNQIEI